MTDKDSTTAPEMAILVHNRLSMLPSPPDLPGVHA